MEDRYLLISDVDGTLLGDDQSLARFAEWVKPRRDWLRLVYNSGRLCDSVARSVESTLLPAPDAIIGGVGTEMRCYSTGQPVGDWLAGRNGWHPETIRRVVARHSELRLQPAEFLSDFKISYYAQDAAPSLIEELRAQLKNSGCDVELVYSSNRDLDVLPQGVDKGSAAAFLAAHWSYGNDHVFVSGDTGNDLAMFQHGFRGIVVANAHPELKQLDPASTFQATRTHAGGVLEGILHWLLTYKNSVGPGQPASTALS